MLSNHLDFDGDPLPLVEAAYLEADEHQGVISKQCKRDYFLYRAYVDMTDRDPNLPNISIPKIYSIVETRVPKDIRALLGNRPYVPFEARIKKDFGMVSDAISDLVDIYLENAGFFLESALLLKLKALYGTAFMEVLARLDPIKQKGLTIDQYGMPAPVETNNKRLRLQIRSFAPWDVRIDPWATNLEKRDGCRYALKFTMVSAREIKRLAEEEGAYPDLDLDKLLWSGNNQAAEKTKGITILREFGLNLPQGDDDMGLIIRYESPDRYIDTWNDVVTLRDIDNPHEDGLINLACIKHCDDPHTQNRIWGIGEAKPNEVFQAMLSDYWNSIFRREAVAGEPVIFYRPSEGVDVEDWTMATGNRIPVSGDPSKPITSDFYIHGGVPMPAEAFRLIQMIERNMDLVSGSFAPDRAEPLPGSTTATESTILREAGSERPEASIRLAEQSFLRAIGERAASRIEQFADFDDIAEIIGPQRASLVFTANPAYIPGGYTITFKGSNRVSNFLIKQRNQKELMPILIQMFDGGQFAMANMLMQTHDFTAEEIQEITEENMQRMQMQQQQAMMAQQMDMAMMNRVTTGKPGGRFKENNNLQIAQDNAQIMRGGG